TLGIMSPSKILVMAAIGIWLATAVVIAIAWGVSPQGFPFLLLAPFATPIALVNRLGWSFSSLWSTTVTVCTAIVWLVAAVEVWRRPKTSIASCLFAMWSAFVAIGYYSL